MKMKPLPRLALLGAILAGATAAHAQTTTPFEDTFSDGNRAGWYISASTASNASVNANNVLVTNAGLSITTYFAPSNSPLTLAATGDSLSLSFKVAYASATDPTGNTALKFGLFNSNGGTRLTADGTNNIFAPYSGYAATFGYTTSSSIRERPTGLSNTALLTSTTGFTLVGTSSMNFGITDTPEPNYYNGLFTITRTATGLSIEYSLTQVSNPANSWSYTVTDTSPVTYGFDTLSFATVSGTNQYLDDIQITHTAIPEPSTYAMLFGALALAGTVIWRRRR